jgi:hypothetical protein
MKLTLAPPIVLALACVQHFGLSFAEMPSESVVAPSDDDREHYLLEMSCDPTDHRCVSNSLRTALALRQGGSTVTVFIESAAVMVADPGLEVHPPETLRQQKGLFEKVRLAGITVLVCSHCAERLSIREKSLRAGLRFTNQEEIEMERARAHKIYQFGRAAAPAASAEPVAGCRPG